MEQTATDPSRMTGLEQIRALVDGVLPPAPIAATIGLVDFEVVREGSVAVSLDPSEHHYNPLGTVHGGVHSTMLDTAAACSVHTTLAVGEAYTSLDLSVKFLRAVTADTGRIRAVGEVVQRGRRTALALARLEDADGRLLAHATSSCVVFPAAGS